MIVDAHVAIDTERNTVERAVAALERAKITRAIVFAEASAERPEEQNGYVLRVARENDLFPFYYFGGNPWTDTRPDVLEVPDNLSEFAGIRWHRWIGEGLDRTGELDRHELEWAVSLMESPEFEAIAAAAAHYNMPVLFEESLHVTLEFVLRFPSLDIIVPHLGAQSGGQINALRELWDKPNVYFDTSLAVIDDITLGRIGTERLLFGSGFPYGDPDLELDKIDRLEVSDSVKEEIFGDNVLSLLSAYRDV